ncbi:MarR family winged helix-turn-helix transcriptional regulator [Actinocrispum wychmicini]|uniref:DNA-binding MarR family transcriptional regulator n=1 Tax=Actinocrispum wychmicini TaxID=1213861 RepID=A0A4R2JXP7_9PSEU|nr:MarR family transcriptional regulator [Actinocrispum wychmicini]TCO65333.1 DNA-binding MarR family transcriptional regulator [Actinocrispum wychmicini]
MSREILDELRAELGTASRVYQVSVDALDEAVAGHLGVNRTDLRCLDVLMQLGTATPGVLGARLGLTTGSVTAMLDRLAKLGYLTRAPDPGDRRKVLISATDEVKAKAWQLYGPIAEEGARDANVYTEAELRLLISFLRGAAEFQDRHRARIQALP